MDAVSESLLAAQDKAVALFREVLDSGMIRAGRLESELTRDIHALARARFGLSRHWHQRIVRSPIMIRSSIDA
jgi:Xaa-Pro dipeptidase